MPVDVYTDHKNLEYFTTTKALTRRQARWSEYLNAFNLLLHFRPGKLGAKPDALTRQWDVYPKEGGSDFASINPENTKPLFAPHQIAPVASETPEAALRATTILDAELLRSDILSALTQDEDCLRHIQEVHDSPDESSHWTMSPTGFLLYDGRIYVPSLGSLRTRVLQERHDHPLSGHPGQSKTLELLRRDYAWPKMRETVADYVKSCVVCSRAKA